jgi:hypothetical protein
MDALNTEALKYLLAILQVAIQSFLGWAAFACLVVGVVLYVLSVKSKGMGALNLIAYLLTLVFVGLVGAALFYSSGAVKTLYYAGRDGPRFNVGRFMKMSEKMWNDSSLATIHVSGEGTPQPPAEYSFNYNLDRESGNVLFLKGSDAGREDVIIEIDLNQREIICSQCVICSQCDGQRYKLYRIISNE